MKIVKLVAENIKGLKAIEIVPDENLQIISGKNGQGKTSVMDSIWLALAGGKASKAMSKPIREGEETANVELDLGDFTVARKWTSNDKSTLQVVSKEGSKFSSPQKLLDDLIGKLSFDPLEFSNLETKEQLKTLLKIVDIDPSQVDQEKKQIFEERTIINREVKGLSSQLESFEEFAENLPEEEFNQSDLRKEWQQAQDEIAQNNSKRNGLSGFRYLYQEKKEEYESDLNKIEELKRQLEEATKNIGEKKTDLEEMKINGIQQAEEVKSLVDPSLSVITEKMDSVDEINKQVREKKRFQEIEKKYESKSEEASKLTESLKEIEAAKEGLMKSAKFPIPELSFDEFGVLYRGVPFKQCSSAERLKVSTAMAMALNPKLRVIRILDGSLLDSGNLQMIQDMAKEKDFQVWVEQVDESGKVGIVIEDGEVKKIEVA